MNQPGRSLIAALQRGLPLEPRPFAALAERHGHTESTLIDATRGLVDSGQVARFGIVVRHRALGYVHNAMVVWDVADDLVDRVGERMSRSDFVTLCYRRPRRRPVWPYNLFCMIHGRDRATVERQISLLGRIEGLEDAPHDVLFSRRCFKQRGARYIADPRPRARESGTVTQAESAAAAS